MNPIVDTSEYDAALFDEWNWLIPSPSVVISLTVFGDWIYEHDNAIYLFSPTAGETVEIATVIEEVDWALEKINDRAPWLHPKLVAVLTASGGARKSGRIFHFVTPLFLGGRIEKATYNKSRFQNTSAECRKFFANYEREKQGHVRRYCQCVLVSRLRGKTVRFHV